MSRVGLIAFMWGLAFTIPAHDIGATELEARKPAISVVEIEATAAAIEGQLNAVATLIKEQDAKLEVLLDQIDETEDIGRKSLLQNLADKLTRSLDKLDTVKANLSIRLDALTTQIDRLKEP